MPAVSFANGELAETIRGKLNYGLFDAFWGKPRSIFDYIPAAQHESILGRTSDYDCFDDIMDALAEIENRRPTALWFPGGGLYHCSETLHIKRQVTLAGTGVGMAGTEDTTILFPANIPGAVIHRSDTDSDDPDARFADGWGDGAVIEGLRIQGSGGTAAHGVQLRARALLERVKITGFSGNGCHIDADASVDEGEPEYGNANNFRIIGCSFQENEGHGLFTRGGDANAGYIEATNASGNGGVGFYDSSFLGNIYEACHTATNVEFAYKSDNPNARNIFVGCYSEGGQTSLLMSPAMAIGDIIGDLDPASTGAVIGARVGGPTLFPSAEFGTGTGPHTSVGGNDAIGQVLRIKNGLNEAVDVHRLKYDADGDLYWDIDNFGAARVWNISGSDTTAGSGGGRPNPVPYAFVPERLIIGGRGANGRIVTTASAEPASGEWARGDRIYHTAPSAGGFEGWVCVTGGTAGDDAEFKTFGAISA
jgi:hypothetical protein